MVVTIRRVAGIDTRVVTIPVGVREVTTVPVELTRVVTLPAVEMDVATLVMKYLSLVSTRPVTVTVTRPHTVYVTHIVSRMKKYVSTVVVHARESMGRGEAVKASVSAVAGVQGSHPVVSHGGAPRAGPPSKEEIRVRKMRVS